jgi:hypothetical protein
MGRVEVERRDSARPITTPNIVRDPTGWRESTPDFRGVSLSAEYFDPRPFGFPY